MRVAFQGELGAYSELAIAEYWHGSAEPVPARTMDDVVEAIIRGAVEAGVIPVENSTIGVVTDGRDALARTSALRVMGEVVVPIDHCLLGVPGSTFDAINAAASHPVALAQCQAFFRAHPCITPRPFYDTGGAAREIARHVDHHTATIAGHHAATRYGLTVLREGIQDRLDNWTRFVVVANNT